jgi:sirohydrochlorin cobaltochelatase
VSPYFLFTGVLVKKIFDIALQQQELYPDIYISCLSEMGLHPQLFSVLRTREIETQMGQVQMNCEMCKFRLAAASGDDYHEHHGHHGHHEHHEHHEHHGQEAPHESIDVYADIEKYHQNIWQIP